MQSCNILLRSSSASKLVSWRIRRRRIHCRQTHRSPLLLVTPDGTSTTTNPILCKCLFCIAILSYLTFITADNLFGFQLDVGLASFFSSACFTVVALCPSLVTNCCPTWLTGLLLKWDTWQSVTTINDYQCLAISMVLNYSWWLEATN